MPALETSGASPVPSEWSSAGKSAQHSPLPRQSLEAFSASGGIPLSASLLLLNPPVSPASSIGSVRRSSPTQHFSSTADIQSLSPALSDVALVRPSTSPASLSSPATETFTLAVELREAHQQLLIQKHAIAAALGAELSALKEERARERRQHAMVMRRMEEELRRMEDRARTIQHDNDRIRAELAQAHANKTEEESKEQYVLHEDEQADEAGSEQRGPVFHSQPPSSRPSISCPLPAARSPAGHATAPEDDDAATRQLLDVVQQLSEQIAALRAQSTPRRTRASGQHEWAGERAAQSYGPGRVWREYEPLQFSAVQPIVFHRERHYTHYDVKEWGRGS